MANINLPTLSYEDNLGGSVKDYLMLMKPRVMSLVVFTAISGMLLAPGNIHPLIAFVSILCITIGAGSAAAINMWYDRDIDAIMKRTQKRPIVTGAVKADEALAFGIITGTMAIIMMAVSVNIISAALLAFTILYYIYIYTIWLKRTSVQNVVIGGVSGALPPIIGWASVTGNISWQAFSLFAIIFIWTPPHSWALALYRSADYKNCNIPMMPVIKGVLYTKKQIMLYSILMFFISLWPYFLNISSHLYLITAIISGLIFLYYAVNLFADTEQNHVAKKLFWYSIFYLFIIFFSLIAFKV
ncbi:MAG: heme o synthase [Candidatus Megaira endosymbiont of Mesostigma viride]|jgi:protoheme IX farnesyltransferase|nr:heme o synthase [Rickettsiales bacterium]UCM94642.1 MAG: heme o synthase [Candidatus Megaira endosymbiont of Mesostigma viride]HJK88884.1 heme o synthase [Candidatus Megaira endosymbiont of Mesostigma viride]